MSVVVVTNFSKQYLSFLFKVRKILVKYTIQVIYQGEHIVQHDFSSSLAKIRVEKIYLSKFTLFFFFFFFQKKNFQAAVNNQNPAVHPFLFSGTIDNKIKHKPNFFAK